MTETERHARYDAALALSRNLTDETAIGLLDMLADTWGALPEAALPASARPCRRGHPATSRYANGDCRECMRLRRLKGEA